MVLVLILTRNISFPQSVNFQIRAGKVTFFQGLLFFSYVVAFWGLRGIGFFVL